MKPEEKKDGSRPAWKYLIACAAMWLVLWTTVSIFALAATTVTVSGSLSASSGGSSLALSAELSDEESYDTGSGSVTIANDVITITVSDAAQSGCGSTSYKAATLTLTITNNATSTVTIVYSYEVDNYGHLGTYDDGTDTSDNTDGIDSGTATLEIEAGESGTISVSSQGEGENTVTGTITIISVTFASTATYITFAEAENGSYSVSCTDGTTVTLGEEHVSTSDYSYTVSAPEAEDGYVFYKWVDGDGNVLSYEESYSGILGGFTSGSLTVTAVFREEDAATFYIEGEEGVYYYYLDEAIEAAEDSSSKKIVMYGTDSTSSPTTGTVYGSEGQTEFTIPSEITLLLPYDQDDLDLGDNYGDDDAYSNTSFSHTQSWGNSYKLSTSCVLTLTVPAGTSITVEGALVIGGKVNTEANSAAGAPCGSHANLELEGTLTIADAGVLSACGYIYGEGSVTCLSGAEVYEPIAMLDFIGGGYTAAAGGASNSIASGMGVGIEPMTDEDWVMPFNRYAMQNFQAEMDMESGAILYGYANLYANDSDNTTIGVIIGDSSTSGLINLNEEASIHIEYDADTCVDEYPQIGRTSLSLSGGASLGSLTLGIDFIVSVDVDTSDFIFPIPYNFEITLDSGTYTVDNSLAVYPGATLTVGEGATLNVGTNDSDCIFLIYDGMMEFTSISSNEGATTSYSESHSGNTSNNDYPSPSQLQEAGLSRCGEFIVNGTLNIGSDDTSPTFAGLVQTTDDYDVATGTGPVITVGEDVTTSMEAQIGCVGYYTLLIVKSYYASGATVYDLQAQLVSRSESEAAGETVVMNLEAGHTYIGSSGTYKDADFSFVFYGDSSDNDDYEEYTIELEQEIYGAWEDAALVNVVDSGGETLASHYEPVADLQESTILFYEEASLKTLVTNSDIASSDVLYALAVARLERMKEAADSEEAESTYETVSYFESLSLAVSCATESKDFVILMADLTEDEGRAVDKTIAIEEDQDLTICLYDTAESEDEAETILTYTVECDTCLFSNAGTVTLALGGSTVAVDCSVYEDGEFQYYDTDVTEAVYNTGTMTITDFYTESEDSESGVSAGSGGIITFNGVSTGSVSTKGTEDVFAAVVRSTGSSASLSVDNVTLTETGVVSSTDTSDNTTTTDCTAGIVNSYGSTVESITDVVITSSGWALYNLGGTVELIDGGTWSGAYGILNQDGEITTADEETETTSYTGKITTIQGLTLTASSSYAVWNSGTITTIGWGNTFTAESDTVLNRGTIETIGGEKPSAEEEAATVSVITATDGCAVVNEGGVVTGTDSDGNDTYSGASIGLISNVEIGGTTYAIYQTGMDECSTVKISIGELGEGLIAWTTSTAVSSTDSDDSGSDTDSTEEVYYAVGYNTAYSSYISITHISGGDYQHGSGVREYAIQDADSQTYGVYDETTETWDTNYTLSYTTESVTRSSDNVSGSYYYIIPNTITLVFDLGSYAGYFGVSSLDSMTVSLEEYTGTYTGEKITLSDYEDQSAADWEFYGWSVVENDSAADLAPGSYEPAELIAALEKALSSDTETVTLQAGNSVTLYAVWLPSDLVSVTVEWGELYYEYKQTSAAVYTWDGRSMQYTLTSGGSGTWTAAGETTESGLASGTIRITSGEASTMNVAAVVDFVDESDFGLTMSYTVTESTIQDTTFSTDSYTDPFSIYTLKSGESVTLSAALSGTPTGSGTNVTLGKVTVTLTEADAEDTGGSSDSEAEESGTD